MKMHKKQHKLLKEPFRYIPLKMFIICIYIFNNFCMHGISEQHDSFHHTPKLMEMYKLPIDSAPVLQFLHVGITFLTSPFIDITSPEFFAISSHSIAPPSLHPCRTVIFLSDFSVSRLQEKLQGFLRKGFSKGLNIPIN